MGISHRPARGDHGTEDMQVGLGDLLADPQAHRLLPRREGQRLQQCLELRTRNAEVRRLSERGRRQWRGGVWHLDALVLNHSKHGLHQKAGNRRRVPAGYLVGRVDRNCHRWNIGGRAG